MGESMMTILFLGELYQITMFRNQQNDEDPQEEQMII